MAASYETHGPNILRSSSSDVWLLFVSVLLWVLAVSLLPEETTGIEGVGSGGQLGVIVKCGVSKENKTKGLLHFYPSTKTLLLYGKQMCGLKSRWRDLGVHMMPDHIIFYPITGDVGGFTRRHMHGLDINYMLRSDRNSSTCACSCVLDLIAL